MDERDAHLQRDFVGYGKTPPHPHWPGNARLALNIVLNYEEGSEMSFDDGDAETESGLTEGGSGGFDGRDLAAESMFEYGSRVGIWRIMRLLEQRRMPATVLPRHWRWNAIRQWRKPFARRLRCLQPWPALDSCAAPDGRTRGRRNSGRLRVDHTQHWQAADRLVLPLCAHGQHAPLAGGTWRLCV